MKVTNKTERQNKEYLLQKKNKAAWETSLKYSTIIIKNIDKRDIYNIVKSVYFEYQQSLKSQQIYEKNKNLINIWETVINTINNSKNSENVKRGCIKNLYYTSMVKNNM